ncbi:MAG: hypothetical protein RLZZ536_2841, partial [Planctomycetota bacterium]
MPGWCRVKSAVDGQDADLAATLAVVSGNDGILQSLYCCLFVTSCAGADAAVAGVAAAEETPASGAVPGCIRDGCAPAGKSW